MSIISPAISTIIHRSCIDPFILTLETAYELYLLNYE